MKRNKVLTAEEMGKVLYHRVFNGIYKANQCCDLNDIQIAIYELNQLAKYLDGNWTYEMNRRLGALNKREMRLRGKKTLM